jgi:hypothetical protein
MNKKPKPTSKTVLIEAVPDIAVSRDRGILKTSYNHRTRSLARTLVDSVDEESKKRLRSQMRDFTSYGEILDHAKKLGVSTDAWNSLIEGWFDAGTKGE